MSVGELAPILIPVATIVTGYLAYRAGQHNTARQERADVLEGYRTLCDDLREMIRINDEEIARLRQELKEIKAQFLRERAEWKAERLGLLARIEELERVNRRLEERLAELQAEELKE